MSHGKNNINKETGEITPVTKTLEQLKKEADLIASKQDRYTKRRQRFFTKPSKTQQHLRHDVDTKEIMKRYLSTGQLPNPSQIKQPQYGNFTDVNYFRDMTRAKAQVSMLVEQFNNLPINLQQQFGMDPGAYVQYLNDERNHPEAIKLGLIDDYISENLANNPPLAKPSET